jgi:2-methylcitrate dehydratase PrpD
VTFCERAGRWAADLTLADVPERALERARIQRVSMAAARLAGEEAARPFAAAAPDGPLGDVFAAACASMAHDWDDYLYMGHTGHSSVWVSRAFAPGDDERALVAQVAANEVAGRLGAALLIGPHNGQFWSSIHCASGAVAAGVAIGLDGERLGHALAIALYQPPYGLWPGFMGPDTKLLTAAEPAVQGARAALLAAEGVRGALGVVEDRRGLLRHLSFAPRPELLGELGRTWLTDTLAFKPFPGCAYLQAAVEGALRAGVPAAEVAEITIDAGYLTMAMERLGAAGGLTPVGIAFSASRSVAVALIAGQLTHAELAPAWLADHAAAVQALASRVRLRHDWALTLRSARGVVDAGASVRDVPARAWPRVLRRMRELGMDEAALPPRELVELARRRDLRGELRALLAGGGARGLAGLDTGRLRMTFPCRLAIRLRSGRVVEVEGEEPGASAHALDEQRGVVESRCRAAGLEPALT